MTALVTDGDRVAGVVGRRPPAARSRSRADARRADRRRRLRAQRRRGASEHGVPGDADWTMAPRGTNTGEPIAAAVALGAATDLLDQGWFCPGLEQPDGSGSFTLGFRSGADRRRDRPPLRQRVPALRPVRPRDGRRRRSGSRRGSSSTPARAAGCRRSRCPRATRPTTSRPAPGCSADTARGARRATRAAGDALVATVERFNGFAATGVDEDFGRGEDEYDTFFAGGDGPEQGARRRVDAAAVLRRPVRALRPRHQGRPRHRRRRPGAARGRHR